MKKALMIAAGMIVGQAACSVLLEYLDMRNGKSPKKDDAK